MGAIASIAVVTTNGWPDRLDAPTGPRWRGLRWWKQRLAAPPGEPPRKPRTAAASAATPAINPAPASKIDQVIVLLRREQGATLPEIVAATGWQTHSTRATLTGLRKKGHTLAKDKRGDVTCYRSGTAA